MKRLLLPLLLLLAGVTFAQTPGYEALDARLTKLVQKGCVLVGSQTQVLYRYPRGCNPTLVPASLLKIANAYAALSVLGDTYRFPTEVYSGADQRLGIKGFGDPYLTSETWADLAQALAAVPGVSRQWKGLFLDTSTFDPELAIPGLEASLDPYNAKIGSLSSNFNTVYVEVLPNGTVRSAEPQTPLTQVARTLAQGLKPGKHRINITLEAGRSLDYSAELARLFLEQQGFQFAEAAYQTREVSPGDQQVLRYQNPKKLPEVLAGMLQYSNNFIANELLLAMGRQQAGSPTTLGKGVRTLHQFLETRMGWAPESFQLAEGSGISRQNRMTPEMILDLLRAFEPYQSLLPLEKGVRLKTGTLKGIYNIAGYFPDVENRYFVVMLEQTKNYRNAVMRHLLRTSFPEPAGAN